MEQLLLGADRPQPSKRQKLGGYAHLGFYVATYGAAWRTPTSPPHPPAKSDTVLSSLFCRRKVNGKPPMTKTKVKIAAIDTPQ